MIQHKKSDSPGNGVDMDEVSSEENKYGDQF